MQRGREASESPGGPERTIDHPVVAFQRLVGNRATGQLLARRRSAPLPGHAGLLAEPPRNNSLENVFRSWMHEELLKDPEVHVSIDLVPRGGAAIEQDRAGPPGRRTGLQREPREARVGRSLAASREGKGSLQGPRRAGRLSSGSLSPRPARDRGHAHGPGQGTRTGRGPSPGSRPALSATRRARRRASRRPARPSPRSPPPSPAPASRRAG